LFYAVGFKCQILLYNQHFADLVRAKNAEKSFLSTLEPFGSRCAKIEHFDDFVRFADLRNNQFGSRKSVRTNTILEQNSTAPVERVERPPNSAFPKLTRGVMPRDEGKT
jgi:hypothetical protein